jgi:CheY-like chemotaxis protein
MLLKNKLIFVVEDNPRNRAIFTLTLKLSGAVVKFDIWGRDALYHLKGMGHVDVIILDLMLFSGISGYDVFDEIRALPQFAAVPILAVSAADPAIALPKTRAKGFAGFIAKPIDDTLFPQQVAKVIAGEQVWYAGERYASTADSSG